MDLGKRLKQLRESRGWNQKQLAAEADVHPSIISLMERDARNNARPETLSRLAKTFGVSIEYLLGGEATNDQIIEGDHRSPDDDYRPAIALARELGLSPEDLTNLIRTTASLFAKK